MQRLALALLMALCVGIVPFVLAGNGRLALFATLLLATALSMVRHLASTPPRRHQ